MIDRPVGSITPSSGPVVDLPRRPLGDGLGVFGVKMASDEVTANFGPAVNLFKQVLF